MSETLKELIYTGSSRKVWRVEPGILDFEFTDTFSVFDVGVHHQQIPGKGRALCASAVRSFEIAERIGVATHFIKRIDPVTIRVKEFKVLDPEKTDLTTEGHVLPAEWITRFAVEGSLWRAFKCAKKSPRSYGFTTDSPPPRYAWLPWPVEHLTTKREVVDRDLSGSEAGELMQITGVEERNIWNIIHRLDGALSFVAAMAGFARPDGKKEVGLGVNRRPIILDTFGTPDEDRFAPIEPLRRGEIIDHSKEMIRQLFIANGYYGRLIEARGDGWDEEPPYPDLTPEEIAEVSRRYEEFATKYCSVNLGLVPGLG